MPQPSVFSSTYSSWMTTRWPSVVICTSTSRPSTPASTASLKASIVFSGWVPMAALCAYILVMVLHTPFELKKEDKHSHAQPHLYHCPPVQLRLYVPNDFYIQPAFSYFSYLLVIPLVMLATTAA